jgi:hypothetical protein
MYERTHKTGRGLVHILEMDVSEFSNIYELAPTSKENTGKSQSDKSVLDAKRLRDVGGWGGGADWFGGCKSTREIQSLLQDGWQEGATRIRKVRDQIAAQLPVPKSRRRRPRWADDGHTIDEDRALEGRWDDAYRTARREVATGPQVVEIVGAFGGNCHISADQMFWNGATALIVSDILEDAGYAVRLTANSGTADSIGFGAGGRNLNSIFVELKDAGDPLRIDALAAIVCHAGIYRTLGFQAILRAPFDVGSDLGSHVDPGEVKDRLAPVGEWPTDRLVLNTSYNEEAALEEVKRILAQVIPVE